MQLSESRPRILLVDDNPAIHQDFIKILKPAEHDPLEDLEAEIFGAPAAKLAPTDFELESAFQGQEALERVRATLTEGCPFAMAFVDVRMPPGWDGIETIQHLWRAQPDLEVVVCTAYSDYSWEDTVRKLGCTDRFIILKKPFDNVEVLQLAHGLTEKWRLRRQAAQTLAEVEERMRREIAVRELREVELRNAQKLEAVGRLASGVAHEINTPIQFVSDGVQFVREACMEAFPLLAKYQQLREAVGRAHIDDELVSAIVQAEGSADLAYLAEEVPRALADCAEGLSRVTSIVRSMRVFAHPDQGHKAPADLNAALATTLTIARSEYKYVAEVTTDFGELPPVTCHIGEINQVLLNIIANAAHAIADVVGHGGDKGRIEIATRVDGGDVLISISDSGGGIPDGARGKIFEPFYTTKEVGRGTGQGLAIAHTVVVNHHGGELSFTSEVGRGTTFVIRLPIAAASSSS